MWEKNLRIHYTTNGGKKKLTKAGSEARKQIGAPYIQIIAYVIAGQRSNTD